MREKYGIHPGDFLLTSTVGGGGFTEQAQTFFEKVLAVHRHLHGALPRLRHLVIRGPNFAGAVPAAEGMTVIDVEPQMIDLLAISDLAIAEGGYNTVSEIRITKTPAVFLPSTRGKDDQEERVRVLEWMGLAYVLSDLPPDELARKVLQICSCTRCLAEIRERYRADRFCLGNRAAAQRLLDLAG